MTFNSHMLSVSDHLRIHPLRVLCRVCTFTMKNVIVILEIGCLGTVERGLIPYKRTSSINAQCTAQCSTVLNSVPHSVLHSIQHSIPHSVLHSLLHRVLHGVLHRVRHSVVHDSNLIMLYRPAYSTIHTCNVTVLPALIAVS